METDLRAYLYDNATNKDNLDSLLKEYDPNSFVAFIGAGLSANLEELHDMKKLYKKLCEKYSHAEDTAEPDPAAFSRLYDRCSDREGFDKHVLEITKPKNATWAAPHFELAQAFRCFITTNYYDPIEEAFKRRPRGAGQPGVNAEGPEELQRWHFVFPEDSTHLPVNTITYLHGHSLVGFCVIREKDYRFFYPSNYGSQDGIYVLENSLANLFCNWQVIFLGCSLENHLRNFLAYLKAKVEKKEAEEVPGAPKKSMKIHYWLTDDDQVKMYLKQKEQPQQPVPPDEVREFEQEYFDEYARMNVKPVIYTGGHAFVEQLCKNLVARQRAKETLGSAVTIDPTKLAM